jgi:hypothetical protein
MVLAALTPAEYAADVLPESRSLWGGTHSLEQYARDFQAVARSAYGRRHFRAVGLRVDGCLVSSLKRYERELHWERRPLRAVGIGAIFTPEPLRGHGFASAMLGAFLDAEHAAGSDVAFLFSDIHPSFYERLGFIQLPSREITLRTSSLGDARTGATVLADGEWAGVRRCYDALDGRRVWGARRTPMVWGWIALQWAMRRPAGQRVDLVVKRGRAVIAYAFGWREPARDAFALGEYGFADDDGRRSIGALLRSAAGDLRYIVGWLPPDLARRALGRGSVRPRRTAVAMLLPLSATARALWAAEGVSALTSRGDFFWFADHV